MAIDLAAANRIAFDRICAAEVVLEDVLPALHAVRGMRRNLVLTSGPLLPWSDYQGGQREALIGAALYEGLAGSRDGAVERFADGQIEIGSCQDFGCIGSVAGVYTASMPVFVVRNLPFGNLAFCNFYEGRVPARLNYGVFDSSVAQRLRWIEKTAAPVLAAAVRAGGGIPLTPLMARALHMGDELHSRNTAASYLFMTALVPQLLALLESKTFELSVLQDVVQFLTEDNYFFLRLSMAACKATADAARAVSGSSLVTAMSLNCRTFAIRVSGLGHTWYEGGPADVAEAKFFPGKSAADLTWMGGESVITETVGLGGFAQAAALALQSYQGGSAQVMMEVNESMYRIVAGEHTRFKLPIFNFRGVPTGIDIFRVLTSGILPVIDAGLAGRDGGQIGAGMVRAPRQCFEKAARAFEARYGKAL